MATGAAARLDANGQAAVIAQHPDESIYDSAALPDLPRSGSTRSAAVRERQLQHVSRDHVAQLRDVCLPLELKTNFAEAAEPEVQLGVQVKWPAVSTENA